MEKTDSLDRTHAESLQAPAKKKAFGVVVTIAAVALVVALGVLYVLTGGNPVAPGAPSASSGASIRVAVSVNSDAANGQVSAQATVNLPEGASAYDALLALDIPVESRETSNGVYVAGIGGLREFDYGGASGWLYSVNGTSPNYMAAAYILQDGDVVKWEYAV